MSNMFSDDKKYLFDKFYDCYNREINTLWQRSIFLTAFITGIAVVYGKVLEKAIEADYLSCKGFLSYSLILLFIAAVGVVLSLLWIFMAKGSKANQEMFESKINVMSKKLEIDATRITENIDEKSFFDETGMKSTILGVVNREKMSNYVNYPQDFINNNIFSLKGGAFGVGKINIFLGQFFLLVWSIVTNSHLYSFVCVKFCNRCICRYKNFVEFLYCIFFSRYIWIFFILFFTLYMIIWLFSHFYLRKRFYSGYLEGK